MAVFRVERNKGYMALWSYTRRISPLFMPYWGGIMF